MKTILITGANKGIGFEVSKQLLKMGNHVIISGRDKNKIEKAKVELESIGGTLDSLVLDMASSQSIQSTASALTHLEKLDVIINNAGVLLDASTSLWNIGEKEMETTFKINTFGPFYLVKTLRSKLKHGSRIINISSGAGSICNGSSGYAPIYSSSKTALNALTIHLASALSSKDVLVNAICPGWVRTDMGGSGATRSVEKGAETIVWMAVDSEFKATGKFFRDMQQIPW